MAHRLRARGWRTSHRETDRRRSYRPVHGSWHLVGRADQVEVRFLNDHLAEGCDRNLKLSRLWFDDGDLAETRVVLRADNFRIARADEGVLDDKGPQGEPTWVLWQNGGVGATVTTQAIQHPTVSVYASSNHCDGPARMRVWLGHQYIATLDVQEDQYGLLRGYDIPVPFALDAGWHDIPVELLNQHRTATCDRVLKVGIVWITNRAS